jgi:hypothetical protein
VVTTSPSPTSTSLLVGHSVPSAPHVTLRGLCPGHVTHELLSSHQPRVRVVCLPSFSPWEGNSPSHQGEKEAVKTLASEDSALPTQRHVKANCVA